MKKTLLLILTSLIFLVGCSKNKENLVPDDETPGVLTFITRDSPVGTIGMLDGEEGIVVELPEVKNGDGGVMWNFREDYPVKKVVIATKNLGADTPEDCGNYIERKEKKSCYKNGWYIPSLAELYALFNISEKEWTGKGYKWLFDNTNTSFFMPVTGRSVMMYYTSPYRIVDPNIGDYWVSDEENSAGMIWMKTFCFFESKYWKGETGIGDYDGIKFVVRLFHAMPE